MACGGYLPRRVSIRTDTPQAGPAPGVGGDSLSAPGAAQQAPRRIVIQFPTPAVDAGRYPAKRCVGDVVDIAADVFRDGHELIRAVIRYRGPGEEQWREVGMRRIDAHLGGVRWAGQFKVDRPGSWQYTTKCPGPCSRSACAGAQSHGIHDKITRPGPHGCPLAHSCG